MDLRMANCNKITSKIGQLVYALSILSHGIHL